ncbi:type II toxin-antitoxin system Phd/YefM family antitoxin [Rhizobium giardinii]|jgi:antitoxin (DNA-binding transcriptional repressor) of toxin-antitoxin stability system|uniref:Antitoxin (DNA-binding transcriptional repressor) of toxin-antitoxin stability system n=1 Tax=Rhizobium giardinii TaxID=56731 RepID=A0A7W8UA86_9HYPH|nr:type II toxin-antitoxin system Phd/YefM family antitoxin [Rhizobium giardinii]MBB5534315.1 antitoxin (DNA-binding transcriptional repressor) of toxin-antitoxin stability system [Rhizobium giardinii]
MTKVNMLEAKTRLSQLVSAIEDGTENEIIIARDGKPAARLVPIIKEKGLRRLGLLDGQFPDMSLENFSALDEDVAKLFGVDTE